MRIKNIQVRKLFGIFDHNIPLRLDDRITIIHGPNGYGKTAILFLVQGILNNNFAKLRQVPFEKFSIKLDDDRVLSVSKKIPQKNGHPTDDSQMHLHFTLDSPDSEREEFDYKVPTIRDDSGFPIEMIDRHIDELDRIGPECWVQIPTGRRLYLDDVLEIYGEYLPIRRRSKKARPEWLTKLFSGYNVRLIEAQRLLSLYAGKRSRHSDYTSGLQPAVSTYSRELAAKIQEVQAQYGTFSQQLDSTFPTRVIQPMRRQVLGVDELKKKLQDLNEKRQRIVAAGLLTADQSTAPLFDPKTQIDATTSSILSLYSEDVEHKLSILDPITEKIELFKELLNKRFSYKKLDVESREGFAITTSKGLHLLPADLSSGEQHEIVLLYELLFKTVPNSLILIDEPELSLHVAWQVEFLNDLAKVVKLSPFDAILATHSPQIINDRWDLTEELKGSVDDSIS